MATTRPFSPLRDPKQYVGSEEIVVARTTDGAKYARGRVIAYTDQPTVTIEREDGTRVHWIAALCTKQEEQR